MNERDEAVLSEALAALQRGESIDSIVRRYPAQAADLLPLLRTAGELSALGRTPSAAARLRGQQHLRQALAAPPRRRWQQPVLQIAPILALLVLMLAAVLLLTRPSESPATVQTPTATQTATGTATPTSTPLVTPQPTLPLNQPAATGQATPPTPTAQPTQPAATPTLEPPTQSAAPATPPRDDSDHDSAVTVTAPRSPLTPTATVDHDDDHSDDNSGSSADDDNNSDDNSGSNDGRDGGGEDNSGSDHDDRDDNSGRGSSNQDQSETKDDD